MAHKVGDTVTVKRGPHKGDAHKVIHVHKDGRVNVKPHNKMPHQIKYRHGAATASANDVTKMKEDVAIAEITDEEEYAMIRKIQNHHKLRARQADAMKKRKAIKTKKKAAAAAASRAGMNKPDGQFIRRKESTNEESMLTFEAHSWSYDSGWKKPQAQRKDKFGNVVKDKNVAKNLARKAMKKTADEKKPVSELSKDTMKSYKKKVTKRIGQHATGEYHPTDNHVKMDWELDQYQDKARVHTKMRDVAKKKIAAKGKNEGTIITKPGFKMTDNDKGKLQKIQKMLKRDKAVAKKSTHPGPSEDVDEACWDSHKQVGYKMKGGRRVPNCVPKNENQNAALQKKLSKSAQSSEKGKKAVTLKKAPFRIPSEKDMKNEVLDSDKARKSYMDKARYSKDRANNSAAANMVRKTSAYKDLKTVQKRDKGMAAARRKAIMKFREM